MSEPGLARPLDVESVVLGEVAPARSRHAGRRSAVVLADGDAVVGTADGRVRAFGPDLSVHWRAAPDDESRSVVAAEPFDGGVAVGERGTAGAVRLYDPDGQCRWRYETARELGPPAKESRFFLPFVAGLAADGDRLYVAARRYERDGSERAFESAVYAFEPGGGVAWYYRTDASPISLEIRDDRLSVAYNRCPGEHRAGLVVLDARTGRVQYTWDPPGDGQRRVGDVALLARGAAVASHADYRGYRLGPGGTERWRTDLATPTPVGDERLYAYPNHVHATPEGVLFVTGNSYPTEGRETEGLHPAEHTVFGHALEGERRWRADVGGFAGGIGTSGTTVAVPGAQQFRTRDPEAHGLRTFDAVEGPRSAVRTEGIVTAAAVADGTVAAIEEPVVYHDEGIERGAYRLLRAEL
jgi:outer membrane protein assembly factor BamB